MGIYEDLSDEINALKIQKSNLEYENAILKAIPGHRYNKQVGFGFMGPYIPCPTCPAGIAQPAEGARRFGFMSTLPSPTAHTIPSMVPPEVARFGFMAPYPASPGTPTPSDVEYGFMGYPLAPTYKDYGHPRMIQGYGFMMDFPDTMDYPQAAIITEFGKPEQMRRYGFMHTPSPWATRSAQGYGFMSPNYITTRFFR